MSSHAHTHPKPAPSASEIHHALLRPAILQILRAQGYYSSTPGTVDAFTELASGYLSLIARATARHASHNNETSPSPTLTDMRLALEDAGALWPERDFTAQEVAGDEDTRGVDEFVRWATGKKNQRIRKVAALAAPAVAPVEGEGEEAVEERATDYLDALKRKHNKTDQESKYAGTILGKATDHGEVLVEGGNESSISAWAQKLRDASRRPPEPERRTNGDGDNDSRPPSSGLSSLTDGDVDMMDFEPGL